MRFEIEHVTRYRYGQAVFLEPHVMRLRPRDDSTQRVVSFALDVDPVPAGRSAGIDAAGNDITLVWFTELHDHLDVRVTANVDTLRENPYDFILPRYSCAQLPGNYSVAEQVLLAPYQVRPYPSPLVDHYARELVRVHNNQTLPFLSGLCDVIYRDFTYEVRQEGPAHRPEFTLRERSGTCRDLAVLFADACRAAGLAARFVSGFAQTDGDRHEHDLHAWTEVYLSGVGWRGYDPSHGLMVSNSHVPVSSAPEAPGAAPVEGTFRGTNVQSSLETTVRIVRPARVSPR